MRFRVVSACLLLLLISPLISISAIDIDQHDTTLDMSSDTTSYGQCAQQYGGSCTKMSFPCKGWRINGLCPQKLTSCCVPPGKCTFGGRSHNCMQATTCNKTPGMRAVKGFCGGPKSIQCCVPADACQVGNKAGKCMATASCKGLKGISTPGHCPGGKDNQCCTDIPAATVPPSPPTLPPQPTPTPDVCDGLVIPTKTFAQYIQLVACYEKTTKATPRQVLSDIRQMYYGNEAWSKSTSFIWNAVIPCKLSVVDPTISTKTLYDALTNSQDTTQKTDMGHLFTGWEALMCRSAGCLMTSMPNEEFATWGGDLGSAAAQMAYDDTLGSGVHFMFHYVGGPTGLASEVDLRGDIDAYLVAKTINGASCSTIVTGGAPTPTTSISSHLSSYYLTPTYSTRFTCFIASIGGTISGTSITNKPALVPIISSRVKEFAQLWYINLTKSHMVPLPDPRVALGALKLGKYSDQVTQAFLDWVEARLAFP